jgi:hypothetical protein
MRLAERMVKLKVRPGTVACAWLGQAGYLMKTSSGVTVMIDPYFSDEVEKQEGLKRLFPPPITTDEAQPDIPLLPPRLPGTHGLTQSGSSSRSMGSASGTPEIPSTTNTCARLQLPT